MNKKRLVLSIVGLFILVVLINHVSAATLAEEMNKFIESGRDVMEPVTLLLFGPTETGEDVFAKVLFFLVLLSLVYVATKQVPFFDDEGWVHWSVVIGVSVLGVRFFTAGMIQTILLPYGAVAIALSAAIPFVVYFIFVNIVLKDRQYRTIRKVAWIFFAVIFIGLWITRAGDIPGKSIYIYPITIALCFIMIMMDGSFHRMMNRMDIDKYQSLTKSRVIRGIKKERAEIDEEFRKGLMEPRDYRKQMMKLNRSLKIAGRLNE